MHPARLEGIGWDGGDEKQLTFRVESRERGRERGRGRGGEGEGERERERGREGEGESERDAAASQRVERYFSIDRSLLVNNPS